MYFPQISALCASKPRFFLALTEEELRNLHIKALGHRKTLLRAIELLKNINSEFMEKNPKENSKENSKEKSKEKSKENSKENSKEKSKEKSKANSKANSNEKSKANSKENSAKSSLFHGKYKEENLFERISDPILLRCFSNLSNDLQTLPQAHASKEAETWSSFDADFKKTLETNYRKKEGVFQREN